jgi:hypothetical protein
MSMNDGTIYKNICRCQTVCSHLHKKSVIGYPRRRPALAFQERLALIFQNVEILPPRLDGGLDDMGLAISKASFCLGGNMN